MGILVNYLRKVQDKGNRERMANHPFDYHVDQDLDIAYMSDGSTYHLLDVYSPRDAAGTLPVIVEVHGGAYVSCSKEFNRQHGQYLSAGGFKVVNINYTLYPEADMKTSVKEVFRVLDWVWENREQYGFDTNHVFLTGDSAGGHLVMVCAAVQSSRKSQEYFGVRPFAPGIRGYAVSCPVADWEVFLHPVNQVSRLMHYVLRRMLRDKELLRQTSYRYFAGDTYPEVMILTTPSDSLLYKVTRDMHEDLERKGIPHHYKEYNSRKNKLDHVFNVLYPDYEESHEANNDIMSYFRSLSVTRPES